MELYTLECMKPHCSDAPCLMIHKAELSQTYFSNSLYYNTQDHMMVHTKFVHTTGSFLLCRHRNHRNHNSNYIRRKETKYLEPRYFYTALNSK